MIHGLDTGFLVAVEVREHTAHADARATLAHVLAAGDVIAIAPQVLAEFVHKETAALSVRVLHDPRSGGARLGSP
jgi:predicted nucleic acid-binding protein